MKSLADEVYLFRLEGELTGMTVQFTIYEKGEEPQGFSMPLQAYSESDSSGAVTILLAINAMATECGQWYEYTFGRIAESASSTGTFVTQRPEYATGGFGAHAVNEHSDSGQGHVLYVRARASQSLSSVHWTSGGSTAEQQAQLRDLVERSDWVEVLEITPDG